LTHVTGPIHRRCVPPARGNSTNLGASVNRPLLRHARRRLFRSFLFLALFPIAICALASCHSSPPAKHYKLEGTIVSVDPGTHQAVIDAKEIPGFMDAMAMPYTIPDSRVIALLKPGDQITADLVVTDAGAHLEQVVVVKKASAAPPSGASGTAAEPVSNELHVPQPGDVVPDFSFVNQDGRRITLRQFRGKTLLLTFIYTKCPLPDFCPKLTDDFARIDAQLKSDSGLYSRTRLLSISFDPNHDKPSVLRDYAKAYGDSGRMLAHWEFAVAPKSELPAVAKFFGLYYNVQEDQIEHSLSTAIISPDGKIFEWNHSNDWPITDALQNIKRAAAHQPPGVAVALN
jgi:protein SCO1